MITCENCHWWDRLRETPEGVCRVTMQDFSEIRATHHGHVVTKPDFFCKHGVTKEGIAIQKRAVEMQQSSKCPTCGEKGCPEKYYNI